MSNPSPHKELTGLLDRVKAASGPDRHLDALVEVQARRFAAYAAGLDDRTRAYWNGTIDGDVYDSSISYAAPRYTASIDAALALVEKMLPGCMWRVQSDPKIGDTFYATLVPSYPAGASAGDGATAPLAILAALLTALTSLKAST